MSESKKIFKIVIIALFIGVISISFANRLIYGTWNIFSYPNRVYFDKYRYDKGQILILTDYEKPQYEVTRNIDKLTGKKIYSKERKFIGNGKVIYLHLDGDRYLALASGGGG